MRAEFEFDESVWEAELTAQASKANALAVEEVRASHATLSARLQDMEQTGRGTALKTKMIFELRP